MLIAKSRVRKARFKWIKGDEKNQPDRVIALGEDKGRYAGAKSECLPYDLNLQPTD